ncbi:hypothetical protein J1605_004616 [Eschrichtius robustus]|uniref:C4b-binding protein alpha oligomerization domain-containing protein n=1 Tax=Eschrichtius robustus TaxID=9764 RepID=A0AB34HES7_ESCRO|nr:hypothetical protein J1605_004616 [Eschrichtius robustus]
MCLDYSSVPKTRNNKWKAICGEGSVLKLSPSSVTLAIRWLVPRISLAQRKNLGVWMCPSVRRSFQVGTEDCEIVLKGQKLLRCLSSPQDSKATLELHKLSLEIEKLERQRNKEKIS